MGYESGGRQCGRRDVNGGVKNADTIYDVIEFAFNSGKGISTDQLDGTVDQAQLSADTGMPVFLSLSPTYDATNHKLIVGGLTDPPIPSFIFMEMPADLDRDETTLNVTIGATIDDGLKDRHNADVSAADLTPGDLLGILYLSGTFRIVEELPVRGQAYDLRAGWSADDTITETEVLAGASSETDMVTLPLSSGNQHLWIWRSDSDGGDPATVSGGGVARNILGDATALTVDGVAGQVITSVGLLNAGLIGGSVITVG